MPHHIDPRFNEIRNDEQLKYLLPEVIAHDPVVRKLVENGLAASKALQGRLADNNPIMLFIWMVP